MNELTPRSSTLPEVQARREAIMAKERELMARPDAVGREAFITNHYFAPGSYAREIFLPKGSSVIGGIHRHAHVNVISKGRVLVATPSSDEVEELAAPLTFISDPATKRLVHALEDTVWTTIHVTQSTDLQAIERELIAPGFDEL